MGELFKWDPDPESLQCLCKICIKSHVEVFELYDPCPECENGILLIHHLNNSWLECPDCKTVAVLSTLI